MFDIDPAHAKIDVMQSRMVHDIWKDKYRWKDEATINDTFVRVGEAIYAKDSETPQQAIDAMVKGLWIPGGRILAGAGTAKRVTLMNCYVNERLGDSMEDIMHGVSNVAFTLQQGGGIGTDFSTLRPEGALLTRTHTKASGPLPFMHMWDRTSATIRSAGDRRGAMMGTMCDTHPDLIKFIHSKREAGSLTQFNISVLISDAFMEAVREDEEWVLYFSVLPYDREDNLAEYDFIDDEEVMQYAYSVHKARDLWNLITENTYEYSEPGVIFIDRVNDLNNLYYCESIRCTNPCGEQPLPPHGTCNLGHINLARCVRYPFTAAASVDLNLIREVTRMGVRFLDNVIDVTIYPLEEQAQEEYSKRRLGLGFTGLADLLAQCKVRYGSPDAVRITEEITRTICWEAYEASINLAKEKGSFPAYSEEYLSGYSFVNTQIPPHIREGIKKYGIRNALLLTVAPTGTGSIVVGNVSSGGEPVFLHSSTRKVLKPTTGFGDQHEFYTEWGYGAKLYHSVNNEELGSLEIPSFMVTAEDLSIEEHVVMQAAAQRWIDASISKTINVPKDTPYEQFAKVYDLAYSLGCKGCTTYRPNDIRGSILSKPGETLDKVAPHSIVLQDRPESLEGRTYKIKWPSLSSALYLTINHDHDGNPFEIFLSGKDSKHHDWTTALTVMISAIFRTGGDVSFVAKELQQIQSLNDHAFKEGHSHPSLAAYIGFVLERHIESLKDPGMTHATTHIDGFITAQKLQVGSILKGTGERCPRCHELTLIRKEGCKVCLQCSYTSCG